MYVKGWSVKDRSDCMFYHSMDIPQEEMARGNWDLRGDFDRYIGYTQLDGKRLLDCGTATGFLSFEAEKRGADVVSFDMDTRDRQHLIPKAESNYYKDRNAWVKEQDSELREWHNAYWYCHQRLGSKAKVYYGDIYRLPDELGMFDVVLAGTILMHLRDPVGALESMARRSRDIIIVVDHVNPSDDIFQSINGSDVYHWWKCSLGLYRWIFKQMGFEIFAVNRGRFKALPGDDRVHRKLELTTIVAQKIR